jgi:hypothetical protein
MSIKFEIWRATVGRFTNWLNAKTEQRLHRESFNRPLVHFMREIMVYYENGQSVSINSDYGSRKSKLDFVVYRETPLKWRETKELLTAEEENRVYSKLPDLLARRNIRWAYSEMVHKRN